MLHWINGHGKLKGNLSVLSVAKKQNQEAKMEKFMNKEYKGVQVYNFKYVWVLISLGTYNIVIQWTAWIKATETHFVMF